MECYAMGHETVGFPIHSFSTFERIEKYDENEDAGNVGKPYSIEVCDTPRWINLYAVVNEDVYLWRFAIIDFI